MRSCFVFISILLLSACTGRPEGVVPVQDFDINRYLGTWYEIMRLDHSFERGLTNVSATYTIQEGGEVGVLNRGFDIEACEWDQVEGVAEFQSDKTVASLSVTFFWPFAGGYHVFELDQDGYSYAMVSGPTKDYLWVLAREKRIPEQQLNLLVAKARTLGFPTDELILVNHGEQKCQSG